MSTAMDKIITIGGKNVGFRATARTPREYRHLTGRDVIRDLNALQEKMKNAIEVIRTEKPADGASAAELRAYADKLREAQMSVLDLEIFENLAYVMARQYDPSIPDTPDEWLDQFAAMDIYHIYPQIRDLWVANTATTSQVTEKN